MQREIRFRAWDGRTMMQNVGVMPILGGTSGDRLEVQYSGTYYRPDRWHVMQFTGLLDKNGKEIYEGDIVRVTTIAVDGNPELGHVGVDHEIIWSEKRGGWTYKDDEDWGLNHLTKWMEVIGNIYENPELLK